MRRNEACALITRIAQNELIDKEVSKSLLKARDIVICEYNGILDVLATGETRKAYKSQLSNIIRSLDESYLVSDDIRKPLNQLWLDLHANPESNITFYEKCEEMFLPTRCKDCPNRR